MGIQIDEITLEIGDKKETHPVVYVDPADPSPHLIKATIKSNGAFFNIDSSLSVKANIKRSDLEEDTFDCEVLNDGTVQLSLPEWALEVPHCVADLSIKDEQNRKITTYHFFIKKVELNTFW